MSRKIKLVDKIYLRQKELENDQVLFCQSEGALAEFWPSSQINSRKDVVLPTYVVDPAIEQRIRKESAEEKEVLTATDNSAREKESPVDQFSDDRTRDTTECSKSLFQGVFDDANRTDHCWTALTASRALKTGFKWRCVWCDAKKEFLAGEMTPTEILKECDRIFIDQDQSDEAVLLKAVSEPSAKRRIWSFIPKNGGLLTKPPCLIDSMLYSASVRRKDANRKFNVENLTVEEKKLITKSFFVFDVEKLYSMIDSSDLIKKTKEIDSLLDTDNSLLKNK